MTLKTFDFACEEGYYSLEGCLAGILIPLPRQGEKAAIQVARAGTSDHTDITDYWKPNNILVVSGGCYLWFSGEGQRVFIFIGLEKKGAPS